MPIVYKLSVAAFGTTAEVSSRSRDPAARQASNSYYLALSQRRFVEPYPKPLSQTTPFLPRPGGY